MDYLLNFVYLTEVVVTYHVLNLIINGLPSKLHQKLHLKEELLSVLNLIINGLPSKL